MICSSCGSDSPRTKTECINCGNKLSVVRCKCGFLNSLMDSYCGSCGKQLMKSTLFSRMQNFESSANPVPNFTDEELMQLLEIQQIHAQQDRAPSTVSQDDIDKLFTEGS